MSESLVQSLIMKYGKDKGFMQGYGMTELSPLSHMQCTLNNAPNLGTTENF